MDLHYRRSLAGRVTLLATLAVGLSVAIVALAAFITVRHQLGASLDQSLYKRATAAAQSNALSQLSLQQIPLGYVGAADVKVIFVNAAGVQYSTKEGPDIRLGPEAAAVARGQADAYFSTVHTPKGRYRVVTVPTTDHGIALSLAQSLEPNDYTLDKLGLVLLIFGAAGVITSTVAGWAVARNGLRPVRRLTTAAEDIARTEQLDPIEVEGNDEIARLASAFNAMLAALSASRDRQRQLVADAGHELRTPLTSLRTNLDLLTQADRQGGLSESARDELMGDIRFQIEELTTLIGDLVELAREEPVAVAVEPVDLSEIVDRAVERVRRRAPDVRFDVRTDSWWVTGESSALERAVTNLLDNAAKWSPADGVVAVRLEDGTLHVTDQGPGISDEDLPHVFDRFYRSPESRTLPGSGLGLSIVAQVAGRHGGRVRAGKGPDGGASLSMQVPGSRTQPEQGPAPAARERVRPAAGSERV